MLSVYNSTTLEKKKKCWNITELKFSFWCWKVALSLCTPFVPFRTHVWRTSNWNEWNCQYHRWYANVTWPSSWRWFVFETSSNRRFAHKVLGGTPSEGGDKFVAKWTSVGKFVRIKFKERSCILRIYLLRFSAGKTESNSSHVNFFCFPLNFLLTNERLWMLNVGILAWNLIALYDIHVYGKVKNVI